MIEERWNGRFSKTTGTNRQGTYPRARADPRVPRARIIPLLRRAGVSDIAGRPPVFHHYRVVFRAADGVEPWPLIVRGPHRLDLQL